MKKKIIKQKKISFIFIPQQKCLNSAFDSKNSQQLQTYLIQKHDYGHD